MVTPGDQMLQNVTVGKNPTATRFVHAPRRPPAGAGAARLFLQPQQPRYLGKFAETVETPAISLELLISATTLWAAAPTRFPSAAVIPAHSTFQCPPSWHPTYPSAHFARVGVRLESSHPAERTNKKNAGSHRTGGLDDHPHLLQRQVSSRALPITQHFAKRAPARAFSHPIALAHQPPLPPLVAHSAPARRSAAISLSHRPSSRRSLLPQTVRCASHALRRQRGAGNNRRRLPPGSIARLSRPLCPQRLDQDFLIRPSRPSTLATGLSRHHTVAPTLL